MAFAEGLMEFYENNAELVWGLAGTIIGAVFTLLVNWMTATRNARLRMREKLLERRVQAYDDVLVLSSELNKSYALSFPKSRPFEICKAPACFESMASIESLQQVTSRVFDRLGWLSWDTAVSLRVFQEYLDGLGNFVFSVMKPLHAVVDLPEPEQSRYERRWNALEIAFLQECGEILLPDFVGFAGVLEKSAFAFYRQGLWRLRLSNPQLRHKWEVRSGFRFSLARAIRGMMLNNRQLIKKREELERIGRKYRSKAIKLRTEFTHSPSTSGEILY